MNKIAIFVDGGFYRKRATHLWGKKSPDKRSEKIKNLLKLLEKALESEIVDKLVITIKPKK